MLDLDFFNENGYFIQPEVFTSAECEAMIDESWKLSNAENKSYIPQMMPHRTHKLYLKALKNKTTVAHIDKIVSGKAAGLQSTFLYCPPNTFGVSLHQDNFFIEAPFGQFASAWCPLTDVTPESGGLILYPGSHKEGLLPVRKVRREEILVNFQDPNANNDECIVPSKYQPICPSFPKGSVLFIHGHLAHGSNNNNSDRWRQVLLCTYICSGAP